LKHTEPYAHAAPEEAIAAAGAGAILAEALVSVRVSGELHLALGAGPDVLRVLDGHPVLARTLGVALGRVFVRRPLLDVSAAAWAQMRRGLSLCAAHAVEGALRVEHVESGQAESFGATGEAPREGLKVTGQLPTARHIRPRGRR